MYYTDYGRQPVLCFFNTINAILFRQIPYKGETKKPNQPTKNQPTNKNKPTKTKLTKTSSNNFLYLTAKTLDLKNLFSLLSDKKKKTNTLAFQQWPNVLFLPSIKSFMFTEFEFLASLHCQQHIFLIKNLCFWICQQQCNRNIPLDYQMKFSVISQSVHVF